MADLIDLDVFVKPDVRVKLNDTTYRLPGDPPSEIMLRITQLFQILAEVDNTDIDRMLELRGEMAESVLELFQEKQPDLEDIRLTDIQTLELVGQLMEYYASQASEAADAARPTTPPAEAKPKSDKRSPRSSRAQRRTRSASSTSS